VLQRTREYKTLFERCLFMSRKQEQIKDSCRRFGITAVILIVAAALFSIPALAVTGAINTTITLSSTDSLPVYNLGDIITVRGEKPVPVSLTSEIPSTTMNKQGTTAITSVLSGTAGVIVSDGAKGESRLQVRGFQPEQTLVLYDGRPVALPYYGDLDLSVIPLSNVSLIDVVKGPAPTLYGANSMGGVVNIISQRVVGAPIRRARLSASDNNGYDVILNYGAAVQRLDWWLSTGYSKSDGYDLSKDYKPDPLEDGKLRYDSDYRKFNIDGKLNYTMPKGAVVSLSAGIYDAKRGLPSGTDRARFQRYPKWRRWYTDLGSDGWWGKNIYWKTKLYYDDCENRLQRYSDSLMTEENLDFDSYHDSYALGGIVTSTMKINQSMQNATSVNFRRDVIKRQEDIGESWIDNNANLLSISDQVEYTLITGLRSEIGAGVSSLKTKPEKTSTNAFDLYGGLIYSPRTWLDLHLSISRATRFPTLSQLYSTTSGNPDLKPAKALKLETGYRAHITEQLAVEMAYFNSSVKNLIDRKNRNSLYENLEKADLSGFETGISYDRKFYQANVNYMYLNAYEYNVAGETTTKDRRSNSPRHKIDYAMCVKTSFGLGLSHTGQVIVDRVDSNHEGMRDYYLAHIKATYQIVPQLQFFVNVRNLFDINYQEELYYPMPGRQISAGIESSF
jgi:iron complex outermembrane recepter protein